MVNYCCCFAGLQVLLPLLFTNPLLLLPLLFTQVDPTDASSSSSDLVPNRLALLVCQAMLMRGDDAQQKLQAAVGYLATCSMRDTLPAMLAGCMEALFTTDDWDRCVCRRRVSFTKLLPYSRQPYSRQRLWEHMLYLHALVHSC